MRKKVCDLPKRPQTLRKRCNRTQLFGTGRLHPLGLKRLSVCLIELFRPIANQAILLFVKRWCVFLDCLYYTTFGSFCLQRIRSTFIVLATWDGHLDYSFVIFLLPQYVPMLYLLLYACLESLNPAVRL